MKNSTYNKWVGKRVRMPGYPERGIGMIVDSGGYNTWWLVEWPNGSRTRAAERHLEVVPDEKAKGR